ncbi:MAG: right-handed parallel beta-helix repeat-containing protein [Verrucomicrobia bacterium]|nr:right-handed parallel beta-helix repeat-containing protein [Verrucomicrobiota bacterium]
MIRKQLSQCASRLFSEGTPPLPDAERKYKNLSRRRAHRLTRLSAWLVPLFIAVSVSAGDWYVSTAGNDQWSGTFPSPKADQSDGPFATLEAARNRIRALKPSSALKEATDVYLRSGVYEQKSAFELGAADSGTADAPITYKGYPTETVILSGGRVLRGFQKVAEPAELDRLAPSARGQIWRTDLRANGVEDFGEATGAGNRAELFFDGKPMTLARWPNEGFARVKQVVGGKPMTVHGITGDEVGKFLYDGDRPDRWIRETDVWLHGYWFWDWSDAFQRIQSIDTNRKLIELDPPYHGYGYRNGQRYYALNALIELDSEGEWFLDRNQGRLYFWPPESTGEHRTVFSVLPTLIEIKDASWITFENLTLEATRATAVKITGGTRNGVLNCKLHDIGGWAVTITEGTKNGVSDCEIEQIGEGGVSLSGGDRETLAPSEHFAENNRIHSFGRVFRTYRPAVSVNGVGNRVTHNLIYDGPHNAIQLGGNDHLIEFNEIHHVCFETGDVGAFYMGRDWTARGTVIRHNYFHDIQGPGLHGAMAVYLDDSASGITVFGNVFYRAGRAAFIGGGRDNLIENNIFVDCNPSVHVDARGLGWMRDHVEGDGILPKRLASVPYQKSPWSDRYPQLLNLLEDEPGAPKGNTIARNISVGGKWLNLEKAAAPLVRFDDNWVDKDPGFMDRDNLDFRIRTGSPVFETGFKQIPIEQIGPRKR